MMGGEKKKKSPFLVAVVFKYILYVLSFACIFLYGAKINFIEPWTSGFLKVFGFFYWVFFFFFWVKNHFFSTSPPTPPPPI